MSAQSEALISVQDIMEVACAAYREFGYVPKALHPFMEGYGSGKDNATKITNHFYGMKKINVTDEDKHLAVDVLDYFKGLGLKMLERELSPFEGAVLKFVSEEEAPLWKSGFSAVLPKIFQDQLFSDEWTEMERELGKNSEYVGVIGERDDFHVLVKYTKDMSATDYIFVVGVVNGKDIVKFYLPRWLKLVPTVGKVLRVSGIPKDRTPGHKQSSLTKAKETKLCMVFTERGSPK